MLQNQERRATALQLFTKVNVDARYKLTDLHSHYIILLSLAVIECCWKNLAV